MLVEFCQYVQKEYQVRFVRIQGSDWQITIILLVIVFHSYFLHFKYCTCFGRGQVSKDTNSSKLPACIFSDNACSELHI